VVTIAGFNVGAHHSNVDGGESVYCDELGCGSNDVHIEVAPHPRDTDLDKAEQMNEEGVWPSRSLDKSDRLSYSTDDA
jgi:hypothetical protein